MMLSPVYIIGEIYFYVWRRIYWYKRLAYIDVVGVFGDNIYHIGSLCLFMGIIHKRNGGSIRGTAGA